ncbi:MAG: hypothetical protein HFJ04_12735 [Lachnospiraceae bacterium]|nr:hypothetical protein [Lachnospiraceae bacterium]
MTPDKILEYCLMQLEDTVLVNSWGEKGIFYNPQNKRKRGVYVLTVKEKDGENDKSSDLNREHIYRVNLGIHKDTFIKMFGFIPKRPPKGGVVDMSYDFSAVNQLIPHPVYGWMGWICVLNPSEKMFEELKPLVREAYEYAREKYNKTADQNIKERPREELQ